MDVADGLRRPADGRLDHFAELAANFPVAGSIYNWGKRIGTATHRLVGKLDDAHRLRGDAGGRGAGLPGTPCPRSRSAFQFVGDGTGKYDYAGQRRPPRHGADHLHHRHQRPGREADGTDQQHGRFYRADRSRAADRPARREHHTRPGGPVRHPGHRRGPRLGLPGRVPDGGAGLGLRDVRLRHRQLARRGDPRSAPDRAEGDPAGG